MSGDLFSGNKNQLTMIFCVRNLRMYGSPFSWGAVVTQVGDDGLLKVLDAKHAFSRESMHKSGLASSGYYRSPEDLVGREEGDRMITGGRSPEIKETNEEFISEFRLFTKKWKHHAAKHKLSLVYGSPSRVAFRDGKQEDFSLRDISFIYNVNKYGKDLLIGNYRSLSYFPDYNPEVQDTSLKGLLDVDIRQTPFAGYRGLLDKYNFSKLDRKVSEILTVENKGYISKEDPMYRALKSTLVYHDNELYKNSGGRENINAVQIKDKVINFAEIRNKPINLYPNGRTPQEKQKQQDKSSKIMLFNQAKVAVASR